MWAQPLVLLALFGAIVQAAPNRVDRAARKFPSNGLTCYVSPSVSTHWTHIFAANLRPANHAQFSCPETQEDGALTFYSTTRDNETDDDGRPLSTCTCVSYLDPPLHSTARCLIST
jgi:hypothetical protein